MLEGTVKRRWGTIYGCASLATLLALAHCGSHVSPDGGGDTGNMVIDVAAASDASTDADTAVVDVLEPIDVTSDRVTVDAPDACVGGNSVTSCGPTCARCASATNAEATCDGTRCGIACNAGFADCDARADNGCEAQLDSLDHCGACGARCVVPANATGACRSARCEWTCNVGFERVLDRCERVRVRPILPQSTTYTASNVVTFEWSNPGGVDEYEVVLGQTRSAIATASGMRVRGATTLRWPTALTNDNTWFWQVRAYAMGTEVSRSAIWAFRPTLRGARPPLRENMLRYFVDVDCDGEEDIAIPDGTSAADFGVYFYDHRDIARSSFVRSSRFVLVPTMGPLGTRASPLGDLDGNGCSDLAADVLLFGQEGATPERVDPEMDLPSVVVFSFPPVGDIDRDGYSDTFAAVRSMPNSLGIVFGARGMRLREYVSITSPTIAEPVVARPVQGPIDRDLDGVFEIPLVDRMDLANRGYFRWDRATRSFVRFGPLANLQAYPVGDISCDGYLDYVSSAGDVWPGSASGVAVSPTRLNHRPEYPFSRGFVEVGDLDNDGCDDLAMMRWNFDASSRVVMTFQLHLGSANSMELVEPEYAIPIPGWQLTGTGPGGGFLARMKQWTSLGSRVAVLSAGGANARVYRIPVTAPPLGTFAALFEIPNVPPIIQPEVFALLPNSLLTPITPISPSWLPRRRARFDLLFTRG